MNQKEARRIARKWFSKQPDLPQRWYLASPHPTPAEQGKLGEIVTLTWKPPESKGFGNFGNELVMKICITSEDAEPKILLDRREEIAALIKAA